MDKLTGSQKGSILVLEGPAGIGKTALIRYISQIASALTPGYFRFYVQVIVGAGDAMEKYTPFYMWKKLLIQLLYIDEYLKQNTQSALEIQQQLFKQLRKDCDSSLIKYWPLLNSFVPLKLPENNTTRELSSKQRNLYTRELIKHLLLKRCQKRPLVVILDDLQYTDSASLELACDVARELSDSLFLVIGSRTLQSPPEQYQTICSHPNAKVLALKAMLPNDCARIVALGLGVECLPDIVKEEINKADGNPLFSEELVRNLIDAGALEINGHKVDVTGKFDGTKIPDTIQGMVTSRIDHLPASPQMVLKVGVLVAS
jgi:predicted ATPase